MTPADGIKTASHNEWWALYQAVKKKSTDIRIPSPVFTGPAEIISRELGALCGAPSQEAGAHNGKPAAGYTELCAAAPWVGPPPP
ncbi:hypothetical protein, partial [Streptomyces kronopolitis]